MDLEQDLLPVVQGKALVARMLEMVAARVVTSDAGELGASVVEDKLEFDSVEQEGHLGLDPGSVADLAVKRDPGVDASETVVVRTERALEPGVRIHRRDAYLYVVVGSLAPFADELELVDTSADRRLQVELVAGCEDGWPGEDYVEH